MIQSVARLAGMLCAVRAMAGAVVTLQPSADTTLFETAPANNLGGDATLVAGSTARTLKSRALIQFNLTNSIPAGAIITSASLQVMVVKESSFGATPSTFALRRVLVSWGEGTKVGSNGQAGSSGEATWQARMVPAPLWTAPGGAAGSDYSDSASASTPMSDPGPYTFASSPALTADVQLWLDHPESNFGWMILSQSEDAAQTARRFGSRESGANAPVLQVEYTQPVTNPLQIQSLVLGTTNALITWTGGAGPFQLQITHDLASPTNWANLGVPVNTNTVSFIRTGAHACFRVVGAGAVPPGQ